MSSQHERYETAERQAVIELYGKLLGEMYPEVRATGTGLVHAQSIVAQIREARAAEVNAETARVLELVEALTASASLDDVCSLLQALRRAETRRQVAKAMRSAK